MVRMASSDNNNKVIEQMKSIHEDIVTRIDRAIAIMSHHKKHKFCIWLTIFMMGTYLFIHDFFLSSVAMFTIKDDIQQKTDIVPRFNTSLLHDKTAAWDPTIDRMWLDDDSVSRERPPAMILLTSYGWNRRNQTEALLYYSRQTRESEFLDGIVNHPWFHPTAWDDIESGDSTIESILGRSKADDDNNATTTTTSISTRFYIFLDISTDCDVHYPTYYSFDKNLDISGGRVNATCNRLYLPQEALDHAVWQSKFITQLGSNNLNLVKLIYFDCTSEMHPDFAQKRKESGMPVVVAHITGTISRGDETIDMGLVPPLLYKDAELNEKEIEDIYTCAADYNETKRPYYITYIGNYRSGPNGARFPCRAKFADLHDNKRMFSLRYFLEEFNESAIADVSYDQILKRSIYSGAPRGDNKYSYRFTEVLASGGIPIIVADDWMLPFRPELVNWDECAIIVPENDCGLNILKYIAAITLSERCQRRQKCYDIYRDYIATGRKVIKGIVDGLELVALGNHRNFSTIHCDPMQPDSDDCNPLR